MISRFLNKVQLLDYFIEVNLKALFSDTQNYIDNVLDNSFVLIDFEDDNTQLFVYDKEVEEQVNKQLAELANESR